MNIENIGAMPAVKTKPSNIDRQGTVGFGAHLKNALQQLEKSQTEAEQMTEKLIAGEVDDLHQVLIAAEKAHLHLQLAVQVRNKVVEAYQEIMHMQM